VRHAGLDPERLRERAATLPRLHTLIVTQQGETVLEATFRGPPADRPVNIKSVAKTVIATLVGCAVDRGVLEGPDQPITSILGPLVPASASPRLAEVTIGHLLSMQAGLERTSGANYGSWVTSRNWVQNALDRPFVADPGGPMLYSTGNSHLLSAILTRATGETTHALANAWLGQPLNIRIPPWDRDPQGIYLGGNNMLLSPRALARFGEMIRNGGSLDGRESCRRLDRHLLAAAHGVPLVRPPLRLRLVHDPDGRPPALLRLGLWRADAPRRPHPGAHHRRHLGPQCSLPRAGPHGGAAGSRRRHRRQRRSLNKAPGRTERAAA
jgi:CubicO group peptidase (beta-lactamase class C family)